MSGEENAKPTKIDPQWCVRGIRNQLRWKGADVTQHPGGPADVPPAHQER